VPGNGLDDVLGFAGLEQVGDERVPEMVKPAARQTGCVSKRVPGPVPLGGRLCRVELVVLAGSPEIVRQVPVAKIVGALQHALDRAICDRSRSFVSACTSPTTGAAPFSGPSACPSRSCCGECERRPS